MSLIATEEEEKSRGSEKKMNERKLEEIGAGVWHNFPGTKAEGARKQALERSRATFEEEAVGKKEDDAEGVFYLGRFVLSAPFKSSRMMSFPLFVFIW